MDTSTKQFEVDKKVRILKLLRWKTKIQTFCKELLFNNGNSIIKKGKNNLFVIIFSLTFL